MTHYPYVSFPVPWGQYGYDERIAAPAQPIRAKASWEPNHGKKGSQRYCLERVSRPSCVISLHRLQAPSLIPNTASGKSQSPINKLTAIATQQRLTYGLSRSPIRAARQKVPSGPALFRSSHVGKTPCRYVQEQMKSNTTMRKVRKLRIPNILSETFSVFD